MQNNPKKAYGTIELKEQAVMFDQLPEPTVCSHTMTMEELGQDLGFVLYETTLHGPFAESEIKTTVCTTALTSIWTVYCREFRNELERETMLFRSA